MNLFQNNSSLSNYSKQRHCSLFSPSWRKKTHSHFDARETCQSGLQTCNFPAATHQIYAQAAAHSSLPVLILKATIMKEVLAIRGGKKKKKLKKKSKKLNQKDKKGLATPHSSRLRMLQNTAALCLLGQSYCNCS